MHNTLETSTFRLRTYIHTPAGRQELLLTTPKRNYPYQVQVAAPADAQVEIDCAVLKADSKIALRHGEAVVMTVQGQVGEIVTINLPVGEHSLHWFGQDGKPRSATITRVVDEGEDLEATLDE